MCPTRSMHGLLGGDQFPVFLDHSLVGDLQSRPFSRGDLIDHGTAPAEVVGLLVGPDNYQFPADGSQAMVCQLRPSRAVAAVCAFHVFVTTLNEYKIGPPERQ